MNTTHHTRGQQGFTLVELAIVLVIVGLLIGGVLKGQELIENTRVTTTVAQVKGIEAGMNTFYDTYGTIPGDLAAANTRLPNCITGAGAGQGCGAGNGDGIIGTVAAPTAPSAVVNAEAENTGFFVHMGLADVLDGVNTIQGNGFRIGEGIYGAKIANAHFRIGYTAAALAGVNAAATPKQGHYLAITGLPVATAIGAGGANTITSSQGLRIDRKYDDGKPLTGTAFGSGPAGVAAATDCVTAAAVNGDYATANKNPTCQGLYLRIGS